MSTEALLVGFIYFLIVIYLALLVGSLGFTLWCLVKGRDGQ